MEHNHRIFEEKHHRSQRAGKNLRLAWWVTLFIFVAEIIGGFLSGSLALLADAGHMAIDVLALGIGYVAVLITRLPATPQRTYGFYRVEILAALFNGLLLVLISFAVSYEAIQRFSEANPIVVEHMFGFGILGLFANVFSAVILHRDQDASVNLRAAYLHVLSDLAGSIGVIIGAVIIGITGWLWVDSIVSLAIAALIITGGVRVILEAVDVLLESVPNDLNPNDIESHLRSIEDVRDLHDLHIWSITSGVNALSCHIIVDAYTCSEPLILLINQSLKERFNIDHVTIQLETRSVHSELHTDVIASPEPSDDALHRIGSRHRHFDSGGGHHH